jgi:molybdate transport system substrate-binding protein
LVKAGGEALAELVYGKKVRDGQTVLTRIHHRQTPLFLMQRLVDAGVTWRSEAIFQEKIGNPKGTSISRRRSTRSRTTVPPWQGAPHAQAARACLDFVGSDRALKIPELYGFKRIAVKPQ